MNISSVDGCAWEKDYAAHGQDPEHETGLAVYCAEWGGWAQVEGWASEGSAPVGTGGGWLPTCLSPMDVALSIRLPSAIGYTFQQSSSGGAPQSDCGLPTARVGVSLVMQDAEGYVALRLPAADKSQATDCAPWPF